jgi:hypothetical protein
MESGMFGVRFGFAGIAVVAMSCLVSLTSETRANIKICQGLEQSYEQIERGASTV